ncbi:uncharacterized protein LOC123272913 [Cotesia glomerata]|uniref:uncharacterized protein LOC123272913 n=1 Tax=Cotesia glomerata TaxID=32391 RepID=UPI001D02816E|nr:uncharacterized protein LOC123272913 [Cotesia glomerata]
MLQATLCEVQTTHQHDLIVLGGDFNARVGVQGAVHEDIVSGSSLLSYHSSLDTISSPRGSLITDFCETNGFILLNGRLPGDSPAQYTYCSSQGKSVIDLIWTNLLGISYMSDIQVISTPTTSDHFPVLLSLVFPSLVPHAEPPSDSYIPSDKLFWKQNLQPKYLHDMLWSRHLEVSFDTDSSDLLSSNLTETIYSTAKALGMSKTQPTNIQNRLNKPWFDRDCATIKNHLKLALKATKAAGFSQPSLSNYLNLKKSYKTLLKSKSFSYKLQIVQRFSDTNNSIQFWRTFNNFRRQSHPPPLPLATWNEFYKDIYLPRLLDNCLFFGMLDPVLDAEFTFEEITKSISSLKDGKAPGMDSITTEFYKNLPNNWLLYIQSLFNKILDTEQVPDDWACVAMFMLHKKGDRSDLNNYRGLAMVNVITKIFTSALKNRLIQWIDHTGVLPDEQAGFTANKSCDDNIFALLSAIQLKLSNKSGRLYGLFVDFKRAFDSVPHGSLWRKLLANNRSNSLTDLCMLLYADDLVLLANTTFDLKRKLTVLRDYCSSNSLSVNLEKIKCVHFRRGGPRERSNLLYRDNSVDWSEEYVYLGVPFTGSSLGLTAARVAAQRARTASGAAISALASIRAESWEAHSEYMTVL